MSGLEAIPVTLVVKVIYKTIVIGNLIVNDYRSFLEDHADYKTRLEVEITRLEGVKRLLERDDIAAKIKPEDRRLYANIIRKLHALLIEYVQKTGPHNSRERKIAAENSAAADALFREIREKEIANTERQNTLPEWWQATKNRIAWAVGAKLKARELVEAVEAWGETLEKLRSSTILPILTRIHLPTKDIDDLFLNDDVGDTKIKTQVLIESRSTTEGNGALKSVALKQSQISFTDLEGGDGDLGSVKRRRRAQFLDENGAVQEVRVIVEFKDRPPTFDPTESDKIGRDLRSLVRMLRLAAETKKTFPLLYCHGFYESDASYGLVYQLPKSPDILMPAACTTLSNVLTTENYQLILCEDIQNRLEIAKCLANAIFDLHSVQWLHKSINSDNILLFKQRSASGKMTFDWSRPYIVGFGTSRHIHFATRGVPQPLRWQERVYTHPDRQSDELVTFRKAFDIYSLGVVLLEIGNVECYKTRDERTRAWKHLKAKQLQEALIDESRKLDGLMGATYAKIVRVCLQGRFQVEDEDAEETQLSDAFRTQVRDRFDRIRY
jgi:serine/threonine protein kinase